MKKWLWLLPAALLAPSTQAVDLYSLGAPDTFRVGAFAAFPTGGDVQQGNTSGGADLIYQVTRYFSLEGSLLVLQDKLDVSTVGTGIQVDGDLKLEIVALALTARGELPVSSRFGLYGGGGIGYYNFNPNQDVTVSPRTPFEGLGTPTDFDTRVNPAWGCHWVAGARLVVFYNIELFADYRYTRLDTDIEFDADVRAVTGEVLAKINEPISSYDHGLWRVGFNGYF